MHKIERNYEVTFKNITKILDFSSDSFEKLKDEMGNYQKTFHSKDMMWGVDYRSDSKGIKLVIDKSFSTNRDALQGLSRVGRFGDECMRYLVGGVELFNPTTDMVRY